MTSYLTGTLHTEERYDEWIKKFDKSLLKNLKQNNYYTKILDFTGHKSSFISNYLNTDDLFKYIYDIRSSNIVNFTIVWIAKLSPNFLTNEIIPIGKKLGEKFLYFLNANKNVDIFLNKKGFHTSNKGEMFFNYALNDKDLLKKKGLYYFMLNPIMHDGFDLDKNCNRLDFKYDELQARYFNQFSCTIRHLTQILKILKENNLYDNSLILIHGDHGSHELGQLTDPRNSFKNTFDNNSRIFDKNFRDWTYEGLTSRAKAYF